MVDDMTVKRVESRRPSNSVPVYLQRPKASKVNINFANWNNPNNETVQKSDWEKWAAANHSMNNAATPL
jgi:hypothetical protein